jgi:Putative quorum-sensing-regulated virulence factor
VKIQCQKCGESEGEIIDRIFANGTEHKELKCMRCGGHQRFMPKVITFDEAKRFVLPFGKHRGCAVEKVPRDYLDWMAAQSSVSAPFRAVREYLTTIDGVAP